jgi:hypothetical protein
MKNQITIDSKIGYLNERTGNYKYAIVTGFTEDGIKLKRQVATTRYSTVNDHYTEKTEDVIKFLKTPMMQYLILQTMPS